MAQPQYLSEEDVRGVVRLLGQVAAIDQDLPAKRRALAEGVCRLVDANVYVWLNAAAHGDGKPMPYAFVDGGWDDQAARDMLLSLSQDPQYDDPAYDKLRAFPTHVTLDRRELTTEQQHAYYQQVFKPVGLDHQLCSFYPLGEPGVFSLVMMFRRIGRPEFTDRERLMFHIISGEVDWLHRDDLPADRGRAVAALSPRQRQVLLLLLSGHAAKDVALRLHLSPHTINDYIREIYRHFDVTSRAELLAMFLAGGLKRRRID